MLLYTDKFSYLNRSQIDFLDTSSMQKVNEAHRLDMLLLKIDYLYSKGETCTHSKIKSFGL